MLKTVIIDDEAPARNNLKQIIKDNFNDVLLIGEADSVKTGVALIEKIKPELVLLDINLSDGMGFNILEALDDINFQIIFVTAYDSYAIKAFEFNALDYILKPIEVKQLGKALEKAKKLVSHKYITKEELEVVLDNYNKKEEDMKLAIYEASTISFVAVKDIVWCEADGNYTTFYFADGTKKVATKTLKMIELQLPGSLFYRVHQSNVINLNFVKEYCKEEGGYVVLTDNTKINIARRRKDEFLKILQEKFSIF